MSKTIKQFEYQIFSMKKEYTLPFDPFVQIVLDHYSMDQNNNAPIISAHLMTEAEIEGHIQLLKADLDAVGKRAKAALLRAKTEATIIVPNKISN